MTSVIYGIDCSQSVKKELKMWYAREGVVYDAPEGAKLFLDLHKLVLEQYGTLDGTLFFRAIDRKTAEDKLAHYYDKKKSLFELLPSFLF